MLVMQEQRCETKDKIQKQAKHSVRPYSTLQIASHSTGGRSYPSDNGLGKRCCAYGKCTGKNNLATQKNSDV